MIHEQTKGPWPRTVLWFHHLHTNEVQSVRELCSAERGKILYSVEIKGKPRPMLILWRDDDLTFHTFVMSGECRRPKAQQVMVDKDSFVDCSRVIEYSEAVVFRYPKEEEAKYAPWTLDSSAWNKVLAKLYKGDRDCITYEEFGPPRLGATGTDGDLP